MYLYSLVSIFVTEIDRAFKQFVFECMDLAGTDANGFIITRGSEGLEHSAIPWDDPYPFFGFTVYSLVCIFCYRN